MAAIAETDIKHKQILAWLDLEMTGLDPHTCAIVQMALILTNTDLEEIAPPLVINIWQPESVLEQMSPFVRALHDKSGLLAEVRRSQVSLEDAQKQAMLLLSSHAAFGSARLCGNSIGQDRRFLYVHMPVFEAYLHYRQIDVSSLKELAGWWSQIKFNKPNGGQHTALFDIQQSIAELKFYRTHFLKL